MSNLILTGSVRLAELMLEQNMKYPYELTDVDFIYTGDTIDDGQLKYLCSEKLLQSTIKFDSSKSLYYDTLELNNEYYENKTELNINELYIGKLVQLTLSGDQGKGVSQLYLMEQLGAKYTPDMYPYRDIVLEYSKKKYGKRFERINYDQSKKDFFKSPEYRNHEDIHRRLKDPPTYTKILIGEVNISEELFEQLSHEDKINIIVEETLVMAIERKLNPIHMLKIILQEHFTDNIVMYAYAYYKEVITKIQRWK